MTDLEHELRKVVEGEVRFDAYSRLLYSTDASMYQVEPVGVVIPRHAGDVQAVLEVANRSGTPVLPRGAGTPRPDPSRGGAHRPGIRRGDPCPLPRLLAARRRLQPDRARGRPAAQPGPPSRRLRGHAPDDRRGEGTPGAPPPADRALRDPLPGAAGSARVLAGDPRHPALRRRADGQDDPRPRPRQPRAVGPDGPRRARPRRHPDRRVRGRGRARGAGPARDAPATPGAGALRLRGPRRPRPGPAA